MACFELFFDIEVVEFLQSIFITYARSKEYHDFDLPINDVKCYIAILLLSEYLDLPKWETDTETYILLLQMRCAVTDLK